MCQSVIGAVKGVGCGVSSLLMSIALSASMKSLSILSARFRTVKKALLRGSGVCLSVSIIAPYMVMKGRKEGKSYE